MAGIKKNENTNRNTVDTLKTRFAAVFAPSSTEAPMVYSDDVWDIVDGDNELQYLLDGTGQYSQHDINMALVRAQASVGASGLNQFVCIYDGETVTDCKNNEFSSISKDVNYIEIKKSLHDCGSFPIIACYQDNKTVDVTVTVRKKSDNDDNESESDGDVIISWNNINGLEINRIHPIIICIYGKPENVSASDMALTLNNIEELLESNLGKGLSTNDFTDEYKEKLDSVQENVIESISVNNVPIEPVDKNVNITVPTSLKKQLVVDLPTGNNINLDTIYLLPKEITATRNIYDEYIYVNDNWEKIGSTETSIAGLAHQYVYECKNLDGTTYKTILASEHQCGTTPIITCYLNNKVVEMDITKNAVGDLTINWGEADVVSENNRLTISIFGTTVAPVVETEPIYPDSYYPYFEFTKTDEGECGVSAKIRNIPVSTLNIPSKVILDGEELTVTSVKYPGFRNQNNVTSIKLPNTIKVIENNALEGIENLVSINLPDSLEDIGESALIACESLQSIRIPNSITQIKDSAFSNCKSATEIIIPNSVTSIGEGAFSNCWEITSLTIPNSVTSIGKWAFNACKKITSLTIPDSVTSIGDYAFNNSDMLQTAYIPASVTEMGFWGIKSNNPDLIIYCEAPSKPNGWDDNWTRTTNVVWNCNNQTPDEPVEPVEPEEQFCPECGLPMWDGECTNTSCPNSPYYTNPDDILEEPIEP